MAEASLPTSFTDQIQRITALNLFARAFPVWQARTGRTASFHIRATPDGGVEFELGLPPGTPLRQAEDLLELLEQFQRLSDLEAIVSEMRQAGVEDAVVQAYVMEGETLAQGLRMPHG